MKYSIIGEQNAPGIVCGNCYSYELMPHKKECVCSVSLQTIPRDLADKKCCENWERGTSPSWLKRRRRVIYV